ncbi:MAG TPA: 2-phospho-L-lactate transferase, partial [Thermomicrobiales bacterium]|nr:2-phospho-L-lactate transferase [Thermomicrobiales bacterium]
IVNTADDFELYGLHISPDLDTVMYTLAGIANPATGWGIEGDTRATLDAIARYGDDPWFLVGDQDFATHILRTHALHEGRMLTDVTLRLASSLGVRMPILPMTDDRVATEVRTADGWLAFQDYFVARRHADEVLDVRFAGIDSARPSDRVIMAISEAELILFCPSNPLVSIEPILALSGVRDAIMASPAPVVAVSPIVGGKALKGPADRMLASKGVEVSARGVARYYEGLIDGIVIDAEDAAFADDIRGAGLAVDVRNTIMGGRDDRMRLAREILDVEWVPR